MKIILTKKQKRKEIMLEVVEIAKDNILKVKD